MDYLEYNNYFMGTIREKLAKEYAVEFKEDTTGYTINSQSGNVIISFTGMGIHLIDEGNSFFESYQFMPRICEMATYFSLKKSDDTLRIMHQRVLKNNQERFVIISSAASLSNLEGILATSDVISWPYSFVKPTYEETMFALCKKGRFTLDEDVTCIIKDNVDPLDLLGALSEEKEKVLAILNENTRR